MDCDRYREALSAQLDGEDLGMPAPALEDHLRGCRGCRTWAERAVAATRALRLRTADPVPDLTASILAAIADRPTTAAPAAARARTWLAGLAAPVRPQGGARSPAGARSPGGAGAAGAAWSLGAARRTGEARRRDEPVGEAPSLIRLALFLVAAAQVVIALPALFGDDLGATIHVAHEQGAWGLALAAGMAFGAWRPTRATAMLPVLSVFVACLGLMTALDISAGRVAPSAEAPHLMAAFGLVLLWLESHPPLAMRTGPASAPRPADRGRVAA
jgi:predicted anti-sigma-YlaC factor YlaD